MAENIINIDGSEYEFESLKDEAKICIGHLTAIQQDMDAHQMKLVQLGAARDVFMSKLKDALPEQEEEKEAAEA